MISFRSLPRWRQNSGHLTVVNTAAGFVKPWVYLLRVHIREVIEALHGLGIQLATTNYDGLIENVTGLPAVTWMEGAKVERIIRGDDKGVLHLHGYWEKPESVILGVRSYERVMIDAHAQNILRALQTMKTLLFVGCGAGLRDPNFDSFLRWTGTVFRQSEYRRFRLAKEDEVQDLQREHPREQRLFVLSFGKEHSDLARFLVNLRPYASQRVTLPMQESNWPLPPPPPRCFGRDREINDLVGLLLAENPQQIPILGPPVIGKTTIALAALHDQRVRGRYGGRRCFIRCDGIKTCEGLVAQAGLALALQLSPRTERENPEAAVEGASALQLTPRTESEALVAEVGILSVRQASPKIETAVFSTLSAYRAVVVIDNAETPWEADMLRVEEFLGQIARVSSVALVVTVQGSERPSLATWQDSIQPLSLSRLAARETFLGIEGQKFSDDVHLDDLLASVDSEGRRCVPVG